MSTTPGAETMFGASRDASEQSAVFRRSSAPSVGDVQPSAITSTGTRSTTTPLTSPSSAAPVTWPPTGPKPYYSDALVAIYLGDCREWMPEADVIVTDPPYGIGRDGKPRSTSAHGGHKGYDFLGWDAARPDAETFARLLVRARHHIVWGGNYFADMLPAARGWLVWDKGQRLDQADGELAWTSLDMPLRIFTLNRVALMQDGAEHPTQKPISLMRWCVAMTSGSVLDPFMGAGTTLRAAKDLGRRAIGIEIEERYCEMAANRCRQEVLGLSA